MAGLRDRRLRAAGSRMEDYARPRVAGAEHRVPVGGGRAEAGGFRDRRLRAEGSRVAGDTATVHSDPAHMANLAVPGNQAHRSTGKRGRDRFPLRPRRAQSVPLSGGTASSQAGPSVVLDHGAPSLEARATGTWNRAGRSRHPLWKKWIDCGSPTYSPHARLDVRRWSGRGALRGPGCPRRESMDSKGRHRRCRPRCTGKNTRFDVVREAHTVWVRSLVPKRKEERGGVSSAVMAAAAARSRGTDRSTPWAAATRGDDAFGLFAHELGFTHRADEQDHDLGTQVRRGRIRRRPRTNTHQGEQAR